MLVIAWLKNPSHVPKILYVELPVKGSTMDDGALHPPSQKTQPMSKSVLVNVPHVHDRKNYEGEEYLVDIFPMSLGRVDGTIPTPFRDGGHLFFGSSGRAGGFNLHSFR
jgi:hypothetical protein